MASDPFNLQRFIEAQEAVYTDVIAELQAGRKLTHWMWFIFPQIATLGRSSVAQFFAIASREEAVAYLQHPILGPRLRECIQIAIGHSDKSVEDIFGHPDDLKFRSSMTLFAEVSADRLFADAIEHFGLHPDPQTLSLLR